MASSMGTKLMKGFRLIIGLIIWIVIIFVVWDIGKFAYKKIFPELQPESATLAAFFDTTDSTLTIVGEVHQNGMPIKEGKAEILVEIIGGEFKQSALVDIVNGKYELVNDPRFNTINFDDRLFIDVQINSKDLSEILNEYIYVNEPPKLSRYLIRPLGSFAVILVFIFLMWFLIVFTGPTSDLKAQGAFILAYCVIFISLVIPLISPTVLTYVFPNMQRVMAESPVGIILTEVPDGDDNKSQWALNIGGSTRFISKEDRVAVEGGIVIPIYIIILATLGGAINMTRQVPRIQRQKVMQQEFRTDFSIVYQPADLMRLVKGIFQKEDPARNVRNENPAEKPSSNPAQDPKIQDEKLLEHAAKVKHEKTDWREDLINQYMYLLSAPFLGIVTYYLLKWADFTKKPVIVLVSFSIGLISEYILLRITNTAMGILPASMKPKDPGPAGVDN